MCLTFCALLPTHAFAAEPQAAMQEVTVTLDPKQPPLPVRIHTDKDGNRILQVGRQKLTLGFSLPEGPIRTRNIKVTSEDSISVIEVGAEDSAVAVVLTSGKAGPSVLWSGDLKPHGDLGERNAAVLTTEASSDGSQSLFVGKTHERARLCGLGTLPVLGRKRVTQKGLIDASHAFDADGRAVATTVTVEAGGVASLSHPNPHLLTARGSSSDAASALSDPPRALVDGNPATVWSMATPTVGQFVTFGWSGGKFNIRRLGLTFSGLAPQKFRVHAEGLHADVEVPSAYQPGQRLSVAFAEPLSGHCLSLQVIASDAKDSPVTWTEVEAFSSLDEGGGVAALLAALDGPHAADAARILAQSDAGVVKPLVQAWPTLTPTARKMGLPTLLHYLDQPEARATVEQVLASTDVDLTAAATESLLGDRRSEAFGILVGRLSGPEPDGRLAVLAARSGRAELVAPVLQAMTVAEVPATQARLQEAFALLCRRAQAAVEAAIPAWVASAPSGIAAARVASELSRAGLLPDAVATLSGHARTVAASGDDFAAQWWAIAASAAAPAEPEGDRFLEDLTTNAKAWMLRDAALTSLATRKSDRVSSAAKRALLDDYPRVRSRALRILAARGEELPSLLPHLTRDRWHLVRATAAETLPDSSELREGLIKLVEDRVDVVQVAAIERAAALGLRQAWQPIKARLEDLGESLPVKLKAIEFAGSLCVGDATEVLKPWAESGLGLKATEQDHVLAIASIEALASLGAADSLHKRINMVTDPGLRTAAEQALKTPTTCKTVPRPQ